MRTLHVFDEANYVPDSPRMVRHAVRAIILREGALALVHNQRHGEYKFPGGGVEEGESHRQTLVREVREETGLTVLPHTLREYGETVEIRRDQEGAGIFEQHSYYYFCEVDDSLSPTDLDPYEQDFGFTLRWVPPAEAVAVNAALPVPPAVPWVPRDLYVLRLLLEETP